MGRYDQAEQLLNQSAATLGAKFLGPGTRLRWHSVSKTWDSSITTPQGQWMTATRNYERALAIFEKSLGANHPNVAKMLQYLAESLG